MEIRKVFFLILLLSVMTWAEAKETKIKLAKTVLYVGESENKNPKGQGILYVMDKPSKDPVSRQDVITGIFDGNKISSSKVVFSSGWCFEGNLAFSVVTITEKPLQESFTYNLTGNLVSPDGNEIFGVNNLQLARLNTEGSEALKTESFVFKATRKADDGSDVDYNVAFLIEKDVWKATSKRRIAPAVFFEGDRVSTIPSGKGKLSLLASDDMLDNTVFDMIAGDFSGNDVKDASITFSSGWQFSGSMSYEIRQIIPEPYSLEIEYTLFGKLINPDAKNDAIKELNFDGDKLCMTLKKGKISFTPYTWIQNVPVTHDKVSRYDHLVQGDTVSCPYIFTFGPQDNEEWGIDYKMSSQFPEYHYSSGCVVSEYDNGFSIQYSTADFIEVKDSKVVGLLKSFPDCVANFSEKDSKIVWSNGDIYDGSFLINGIGFDTNLLGKESDLVSLMDPYVYLDEIPLQFLEGTYTYSNGKSENWSKGITDYQQNKIKGNYEKVSKVVEEALRKENAAYGYELEKKWQAALPQLRKKYGRANVDAIYNYRLNRKTPVELFLDLKQLGLIKLSGPIYSPGSKNSVNQYVIYMTNRKTGELQYSLVLKFVHPFWSSPDWILDRYSTSF